MRRTPVAPEEREGRRRGAVGEEQELCQQQEAPACSRRRPNNEVKRGSTSWQSTREPEKSGLHKLSASPPGQDSPDRHTSYETGAPERKLRGTGLCLVRAYSAQSLLTV